MSNISHYKLVEVGVTWSNSLACQHIREERDYGQWCCASIDYRYRHVARHK